MFYYLYTLDKYLEQKQNNYNNFKIDDIKNITTAKYKIQDFSGKINAIKPRYLQVGTA